MSVPDHKKKVSSEVLEQSVTDINAAIDARADLRAVGPRTSSDATGVSSSVDAITPELAAEWLKKYNTANFRPLNPATVKKYADLMQRGEWTVTDQGISFGRDGKLLNGQHRLAACVMAGVPFTTFVVRGLSSKAELYTDVVKARLFADYLRHEGEKNCKALATTLNVLHCMVNGKPEKLVGRGAAPRDALLAVLEAHPGIRDSVSWATGAKKHIPLTTAYLAAARYLFSRVPDTDPANLAADVDWFFARLSDGTELAATEPVHVLRELLRRNEQANSNRRLHSSHTFALVIKAWNATRDGRQIHVLTFRPGGRTREQFPMPR